jgi:hypothetical protein
MANACYQLSCKQLAVTLGELEDIGCGLLQKPDIDPACLLQTIRQKAFIVLDDPVQIAIAVEGFLCDATHIASNYLAKVRKSYLTFGPRHFEPNLQAACTHNVRMLLFVLCSC